LGVISKAIFNGFDGLQKDVRLKCSGGGQALPSRLQKEYRQQARRRQAQGRKRAGHT
jgi:hypothetical protein